MAVKWNEILINVSETPTLAIAAQSRRNNLDFLRFFFAALVILDHSLLLIPGRVPRFFGWFAVNGFFIISGFLITGSWTKSRSTGDYIKKRVLRIYPAYLVVTLIGTLVLGMAGAPQFSEFLRHIHPVPFVLKTLFFLTPADYTTLTGFRYQIFPHTINLSVWTIPYEFACYLLVAGLGLLNVYRKRQWTLMLFLAVYGLAFLQEMLFPSLWTSSPLLGHSLDKLNQLPRLVTYFMAGMVFYFYKDRITLNPKLLIVLLPISLVCMWFGVGLWLLPIPLTYIVLTIGFTTGLKAQNFSRYGDISYGVYLYGWPVQKLLLLWFAASLNGYTLCLLTLLIASGCGMLSWHLVEKPCLRFKKRTT